MKFFKKNKNNIENYEEKIEQICEILKDAPQPLSYMEIARTTKTTERKVRDVIGKCFIRATKETTHSGYATPDFILLGDKVAAIHNNSFYKITKSRLNLGQKTAELTRGHIR